MSNKVVESDKPQRPFLAILERCYSHTGYMVVKKVWARWTHRRYGVEEAREREYDLTDKWVDGNLLAAFLLSVAIVLLKDSPLFPLLAFMSLWGACRILEILIVQLHIVLIDPFKPTNKEMGTAEVKDVQRSIVNLLINYLELIFWFVSLSVVVAMLFEGGLHGDWAYTVSSNFFGCLTFDSDRLAELVGGNVDGAFRYLALCETLAGTVMNVIGISTFVGAVGIHGKRKAEEQ